MSSTTHLTTEIVYDRETHDYAMYLDGELVGFARTYGDADKTLAALVQPPYAALLDAAGDPPVDIPDEPEDSGPGGDEPPDIWYALTSEQRQEIDLLCACAAGEHVRDWAGVDALAAFVGRGLRDRWHPMLGERVQVVPSGDVGTLLAVDERGYLLVSADARICLPREQVERISYPAASPIAPASSPLQPTPAGDAAASAAGPEACRVCGEMHAPPSEVCDVNGCGRGPVGVYWFGIPGRRYPARLCSAHGTVVMR